jgi:hypothetical protein
LIHHPKKQEYHGNLHEVTPRFVNAAHQRNMEVHVWTVNDVDDMQRMLDLGMDGIITDYPDRLLALLGRKRVAFTPDTRRSAKEGGDSVLKRMPFVGATRGNIRLPSPRTKQRLVPTILGPTFIGELITTRLGILNTYMVWTSA